MNFNHLSDTHLHASKGPPSLISTNIPSLLLPGIHLSMGESSRKPSWVLFSPYIHQSALSGWSSTLSSCWSIAGDRTSGRRALRRTKWMPGVQPPSDIPLNLNAYIFHRTPLSLRQRSHSLTYSVQLLQNSMCPSTAGTELCPYPQQPCLFQLPSTWACLYLFLTPSSLFWFSLVSTPQALPPLSFLSSLTLSNTTVDGQRGSPLPSDPYRVLFNLSV